MKLDDCKYRIEVRVFNHACIAPKDVWIKCLNPDCDCLAYREAWNSD